MYATDRIDLTRIKFILRCFISLRYIHVSHNLSIRSIQTNFQISSLKRQCGNFKTASFILSKVHSTYTDVLSIVHIYHRKRLICIRSSFQSISPSHSFSFYLTERIKSTDLLQLGIRPIRYFLNSSIFIIVHFCH